MKTKTICDECIHKETCLRKMLTIKPLDDCHFKETEADISEPCLKKAEDIYQKGLDDAWTCARKIMLNESNGGLPVKELDKIFNKGSYYILTDFSASEAIEKIKNYEMKKPGNFQVGDEVMSHITCKKGYVTGIDDTELCVLYPDGMVGHSSKQTYKKTGKHNSKIVELLNSMEGN